MSRRSALHAFALAAAFAAGAALTDRPTPATAQPAGAAPGHGRCVGVSAMTPHAGWVAVYRAYEDGTVEKTVDMVSPNRAPWQPVGK